MVIAYHAVFTVYGFWLPNDPRGSWSDFIRRWEVLHFGKATTVTTRRSLAAEPHDHNHRQAAKQALQYPTVKLDGRQALAVSKGFRQAMDESAYILHACSILPEHVHLVVARHSRKIEQIVRHLKGRATHQLNDAGMHPLKNFREDEESHPSPWARNCWRVYLDNPQRVTRAIQYVEKNPIREGKPRQNWSFVTPYTG